jgi:hypothetical protein
VDFESLNFLAFSDRSTDLLELAGILRGNRADFAMIQDVLKMMASACNGAIGDA